jgi:eukaryotic-like serine/threonine-protein kinase
MPIASGMNIGPYKVDREIGRGGMGVVFLAQDTRLGRTVALKALPDDVATDPDRLQRFEREARVLASLNHPNVAAIYGLEEREGHRYLALEYIEGETLADRIARGPLPLAETLDVCIQIAGGMEAAHDGGVVHRDLKPGNVMITHADQVKILDFGLAKGRVATDDSGLAKSPALVDSPTLSSPTLAHSPTVISPATIPGVILGTAAYLSPEQARGKIVDRRTDIWSFGCIVHECLTAKRAFEGETVSDTIAKILEREMDWSTLPASTPPRLRELLERCLTKDPKRRLRDIGDARLALEEIRSGRYVGGGAAAAATDPAANRPALLIAAASAIAGAVIAIAAWSAFGPGAHQPGGAPAHLSVPIPPDIQLVSARSALGGRAIVLLGTTSATPGATPVARLYVRRMDRDAFEPLRGTERAQGFTVSPDGKWVLFAATPTEQTAQARSFKVPVDGGSPPAPVRDIPSNADPKVAWLESGDIINSVDDGTKYVRFSDKGGPASEARKFDSPGYTGRLYTESSVVPGDRGVFLSAIWYEQGVYRQGIGVLDLKSGKTKILIRDGGCPYYLPTGHLLFTRQDALFAVPFDVGRLEVKGEPVAILDGLFQSKNWINARFAVASDGTVLYPPGGNISRNRRLIVVGRDGKISEWSGERQAYEFWISASPDGARTTTSITNANAITEVWISERRRLGSNRLPTPQGVDVLGSAWSPDGKRIAYYASSQSAVDGLYIVNADGTSPPRRITARVADGIHPPSSWSPDGSTIIANLLRGGVPRLATVVIPANPESLAELKPMFHDDIPRGFGDFSPSGRSIAYLSLQTGKPEVFVCGWDGRAVVGAPMLVSVDRGVTPRWGRDGKKLYFQTPQEKVMAVDVVEGPQIRASTPVEVWDLGPLRIARSELGGVIDILPDGRLLAVQRGEGEGIPTRLDVVVNFPEELKARLAAAKK